MVAGEGRTINPAPVVSDFLGAPWGICYIPVQCSLGGPEMTSSGMV